MRSTLLNVICILYTVCVSEWKNVRRRERQTGSESMRVCVCVCVSCRGPGTASVLLYSLCVPAALHSGHVRRVSHSSSKQPCTSLIQPDSSFINSLNHFSLSSLSLSRFLSLCSLAFFQHLYFTIYTSVALPSLFLCCLLNRFLHIYLSLKTKREGEEETVHALPSMFTVVNLLCSFASPQRMECIPNLIAPLRTDFENAHYCFFCSTLTQSAREQRAVWSTSSDSQACRRSRSGQNFVSIQREYQTAEMKKQEINKEERGQHREPECALIEG